MSARQALTDFRARLAEYERSYETIDDSEGIAYIKVVNTGEKIVSCRMRGFLEAQLVFYLMNMHVQSRRIWLCRHGESEVRRTNPVVGDPPCDRWLGGFRCFVRVAVYPSAVS